MLNILNIFMRQEFQLNLVKRLRNEKKIFTQISYNMRLFRHVVKHIYVYKRVIHPKKSGEKCHLKNRDKLNI